MARARAPIRATLPLDSYRGALRFEALRVCRVDDAAFGPPQFRVWLVQVRGWRHTAQFPGSPRSCVKEAWELGVSFADPTTTILGEARI